MERRRLAGGPPASRRHERRQRVSPPCRNCADVDRYRV